MQAFRLFLLPAMLLLGFASAQAADLKFAGQDYPPFNWTEGSEVTGGMHDVVKAVCEKNKFNCKFEIIPLARGLKLLEDGELDGFMSLIPNPDRAAYSNPSPTIIASDIVYMSQKGKHGKLKDKSDLQGWTVVGVRSASSYRLAKKELEGIKNVTFAEEANNEDLVKKMGLGRYGDKAVIVGSEDVFNYFAKKNNMSLETIMTMKTEEFGVAMSKKKDPEVEKKIFATIESMKKSGELQKILSKYSLKTK